MATKLMPILIEITCLFATFHYLMKRWDGTPNVALKHCYVAKTCLHFMNLAFSNQS